MASQVMSPAQSDERAVKVKGIRADAVVEDARAIRGGVVVQGTLRKQIFWVASDGTVRHTPESIPFTQVIPVPGAEPGMRVQAATTVEHLVFHLTPDGLGVQQKAVLLTRVVVGREAILPLQEGPGPLVRVDELIGEGTGSLTVEGQQALALQAVKITEVRALLQALAGEAGTDEVRVAGLLHVQIFFVGTDGRQHHQPADLPFETLLAVPGSRSGMDVAVDGQIVDVRATLAAPSTVQLTALLRLGARVTQAIQLAVAPGPGPTLKLTRLIGQAPVLFTDSASVRLRRASASVTGVQSALESVTAEVHPDEVLVQGSLLHRIEYVEASSGEPRQEFFSNAFATSVAVPGAGPGMQARVALEVADTAFTRTSPAEVRVSTTLQGQVTVVDGVLLPVQTGPGPTVVVEEVVAQASGQLLVERLIPLIPPPRPVFIERETLVEEPVPPQVQKLVEATVLLPVPAIKIKETRATVRIVALNPAGDLGLLVKGILHLQIFFVDRDSIVRAVTSEQTFQAFLSLARPMPPGSLVQATVEKVLARLTDEGTKVALLAVVRARAAVGPRRQVSVVVNVRDTGITVDRLLVRATVVVAHHLREVAWSASVPVEPAVAPGSPVRVEAHPVGLAGQVASGQVLVSGSLAVTVEFQGVDGVEHRASGTVPLELSVAEPQALSPRRAIVEGAVLQITHAVRPDGTAVEVEGRLSLLVKVVETRELFVVTDVRGPGVVRVDRETLLLDVVDDGIPEPVPVSVVTGVVIR